MEDIFGDILKQKLAQAGGKISMLKYASTPDYPTLHTFDDMYLTFTKQGQKFGAHVIEPPKGKNIVVFNKDSRLTDSINVHSQRLPYCIVFFSLQKPYVNPSGLTMDDKLGEVFAIHLGVNADMSLRKVSTLLSETMVKLRDMILSTVGGEFQFSYISHKLLRTMQDAKLLEDDSRIYNLPMAAICAKTTEELQRQVRPHVQTRMPGLRRTMNAPGTIDRYQEVFTRDIVERERTEDDL